MKLKFTQLAIDDLKDIGQYSSQNWGPTKANNYRQALSNRIRWILTNKPLWQSRPEMGDGIYSASEQSHIIVFWEYREGVEILRILHRRMDVKSHL